MSVKFNYLCSMLKTITLLIFFLKCTVFFSQNKIESPLDSVNKYYSISETILIPENRVKFLNKAFFYAKKLKNDSLLINVSSLLAYDNVMLDNKIGFKEK